MTTMDAAFRRRIEQYPAILTEGAVIERLRRELSMDLDPHVLNTGLIYSPAGRSAMARIYGQYIRIAADYGLPILVAAPTWRANPERIEKASLDDVDTVNTDAVRFMRDVCRPFYNRQPPVIVGGLMACRGDAYKPQEALDARSAEAFHRPQARSLAAAGVDYIMAATLPAFGEARGMARVLSSSPVPYILSFIIRRDGSVLDGTPLTAAMEQIDRQVHPAPALYMVNCVHPDTVVAGLGAQLAKTNGVRCRLRGIQANTSALRPEELDGSAVLQSADPEPFADGLMDLHRRFGLKILGGCCGTDHRHITAIAERMACRPTRRDRPIKAAADSADNL
jgi:homocysteine S-methyltransferase